MDRTQLPTAAELENLPRWAVVAFAARCARRLQSVTSVREAVLLAERSAANARAEEVDKAILDARSEAAEAFAEVSDAGDESDWGFQFSAPAEAAMYAAETVRDSARGRVHSARLTVGRLEYVYEFNTEVLYEVRRDYELLKEATIAEGWTNDTAVSPEFFALRTEFDRESIVRYDSEIRDEIDAKLIEYFSLHPEQLYSLSPRKFEEVVAEILSGFGFLVELTQRTRDGGRDIIAISSEPIGMKLLVECKRYGRRKTVGIAPVQRLHGVCRADGATKGILVTTAPRFTQPAKRFLKEQEWLLEGRAFAGLVDWLTLYQQFQMAKHVPASSPNKPLQATADLLGWFVCHFLSPAPER